MLRPFEQFKLKHLFVFLTIAFAVQGCLSTKLVPENKHLLKKNKIKVEGNKISKSEVEDVLKQKPNLKVIGIPLRLKFYNSIDSAKTEHGRIRKLNRLKAKNVKKFKREIRINERRRQRAIRKGDTDYIYRQIKLRDTLDPNSTLRQLIKYKFGEAPVIADTSAMSRSLFQVQAYMHSKGYFHSEVTSRFDTIHRLFNKHKTKKKVIAHYEIKTGIRYYIDTIKLICKNSTIENEFKRFIQKIPDKNGLNPVFKASLIDRKVVNLPFDADQFNSYRGEVARNMRDRTYYGFVESNISYKADTSRVTNSPDKELKMTLTVVIGERLIQDKETNSTRYIPHVSTKIDSVFFHFSDTSLFKGNFKQTVAEKGLDLRENGFIVTLDHLLYKKVKKKVEDPATKDLGLPKSKRVYLKSTTRHTVFGKAKDSIDYDPNRIATFHYNTKPFVSPTLIEAQNYLENANYYKEYYLERSFTRLVQLGLFSVIKPEILETSPGSGIVRVHYYLVPATKQSFSFEPRAKNSNGFLGLSASLNYTNKNIFKTGTNFIFSISGGFESNPSVFSTDETGNKIKTQGRSFNTFEFGPSAKLDIPGLFPFGVTILGKRQRPRTELSAVYNHQARPDFNRSVLQFNYIYKFLVGDGKTQTVSFGLPGASVIKYVSLDPQPEFEAKINLLNDLYLKNAYRDQFIWEDFKVTFEFDNAQKTIKRFQKLRFTYAGSFSIAGNVLNAITSVNPKYDTLGHKLFLGVPYSQFSVLDNKVVAYFNTGKHSMIAFRTMAGIGFPMKNSPTSLPYDYSFFAGGSNDNRGWAARNLGPGAYQTLLDTNSVATQIGDIRFNLSLEYRFGGGGILNHAFFLDAGNIWTRRDDGNRPGAQISAHFLKELAVTVGYGLRFDFNYFVLRFDLGVPIHNPGLPEGERWIYTKKPKFYSQAEAIYGSDYKDDLPKFLYPMRINFGIGFPF
ncbi:BamA/TamA family outer membrane protein [Fluviicola sp.]|uniref:BamA/TamA family outer membrane protein n=1 Tax=Fluviicola sp. TaxID=1917219 RepID=UPI003D28D122